MGFNCPVKTRFSNTKLIITLRLETHQLIAKITVTSKILSVGRKNEEKRKIERIKANKAPS